MSDNSWGSDPWFDSDGFIDALLDKINFLDILDKYGIEYTQTSSGNFSHKLKCPMPDHIERTASFCVSEKGNNFHCFGCNLGGSIIDFVVAYRNTPYYNAVKILSDFVSSQGNSIDAGAERKKKTNPEHTIMTHVFRSGVSIRRFVNSKRDTKDYGRWKKWAAKQFRQLDYFLDNLEDERWEKVSRYHNQLVDFLSER